MATVNIRNQSTQPVRTRNLRRFLPLFVVALAIGLLSLLIHGFLSQVILVPLLQLLFSFYELYRRLPQNVAWWLFIGISILVAFRAIWFQPADFQRAPESDLVKGRVRNLTELLESADRSPYVRWQLAKELEAVVLRMLERETGSPAAELRRQIGRGQVPVEPGARPLLDLCQRIPDFRRFTQERKAAGRRGVKVIADLDIDDAIRAIERWFGTSGGAG